MYFHRLYLWNESVVKELCIHIRRGLRVAHSSLPGNAKASSGGMSNGTIFHAFLYSYHDTLIY